MPLPVNQSREAGGPTAKVIKSLQSCRNLSDSPDILVCRFIAGRVTFVHRRLWPAIVKLAGHFHPDQLAQVRQEHTASGKHVNHLTAYPDWVPAETLEEAKRLTPQDAEALLKDFIGKALRDR